VRKRIWLPVALLGVLGILALVSAKPLARRVLRGEAQRRGLTIEAGELSLSFLGAELRDVKVKLVGVEGVSVQLERVDARFSLSKPRLRAVEVEGGMVRLSGTVDEVKQRLTDVRARQKNEASGEKSAGTTVRYDQLRGIDVVWEGAFGDGPAQKFSGVQFERGPGGQRLGVDLIALEKGGISLAVAGTELEWGEGPNAGELRLAKAAEMRVGFRADEAAPAPAQPSSDDAVPPLPPGANEDDADDGRGLLERFPIERQRVAKLRALLSVLRDQVAPRLPDEAVVAALSLVFEQGKERLQMGPQRLSIKKSATEVSFNLSPGALARGTPLALSGTLPRTPGTPLAMKLEGGPISLRALGVREGDFGLFNVGESSLSGSVRLGLSEDAERLGIDGQIAFEALEIRQAQLSPEPVRFARIGLGGRVELAVDGSRYNVQDGELRLGEARFLGKLSVTRGDDFVVLDLAAQAPLVACQALVDSAPRGVLGEAGAMGFEGTFSLDASLAADTRKLAKMAVHWDFKNDCRIHHVPASLDPERFRGPFQKEVQGAGEVPSVLDFGPQSRGWTPYAEVTRHLETALLVTEDGRFFKHDGFDDRAIESSIRDNTRAGKFLRGASTISMQLAKNLYLSREKNLARKIQEAALTVLLEQSFDKAGLLELYVNVVEFGPGVYGVRDAARYYFGTTPDLLTTAQAFFLASILPAPTRDYFDRAGQLRPARKRHLQQLFQIARKRDRLNDGELEAALAEELVFGQPSTSVGEPPRAAEPPGRGPLSAPEGPAGPPTAPTLPTPPTAPTPPGGQP